MGIAARTIRRSQPLALHQLGQDGADGRRPLGDAGYRQLGGDDPLPGRQPRVGVGGDGHGSGALRARFGAIFSHSA